MAKRTGTIENIPATLFEESDLAVLILIINWLRQTEREREKKKRAKERETEKHIEERQRDGFQCQTARLKPLQISVVTDLCIKQSDQLSKKKSVYWQQRWLLVEVSIYLNY